MVQVGLFFLGSYINLSSSSPLGRPRPTYLTWTYATVAAAASVQSTRNLAAFTCWRGHRVPLEAQQLYCTSTSKHVPPASPPPLPPPSTIVKLDYCPHNDLEAVDPPSPAVFLQPFRIPKYKPPLLDKEPRLLLPYPYRSRLNTVILWSISS